MEILTTGRRWPGIEAYAIKVWQRKDFGVRVE